VILQTIVSETKNRAMKTLGVVAIAGSLPIVAALGRTIPIAPSAGPKAATVVDATGNLHVPDAYRTAYQFLGSWAVGAGQGQDLKELHVVYASPGTIDAYRKSGRFPDGTVLVKEVFQAAAGRMTTGTVSRAETLKGWFIMMKGENSQYAGSKLWGDGWGWSWFDADNASKTTSTNYKADCLACHVPARGSDWVYVDGYPALKR
jgi:hypothetical protein